MGKRKRREIGEWTDAWLSRFEFNGCDYIQRDEAENILRCIYESPEHYVNLACDKFNLKHRDVALFLKTINFRFGKNRIRFLVKCHSCSDEFERSPSQVVRSANLFCSHTCADKYNGEISRDRVTVVCKFCGGEYEVVKSQLGSTSYCSMECKNEYQKTLVGKNNPRYAHVEKNCEWCGDKYMVKKHRHESGSAKFCSVPCKNEWFAKVYSQTDEVRNRQRKKAVDILENGLVSKTNSEAQIIVNNILDELGISYVNEKGFVYYNVDNYISEYNICIEVMGTYWHCDHRKYVNEINYKRQIDRIKQDKAKRAYLINEYGCRVLYLWESDILEDKIRIGSLVKKFIDCDIVDTYYHSFTYFGDNGVAYMDEDIEVVKLKYSEKVKSEINRRDESKWTRFNCEYCDKKTERLTSHYIKSESHTCSEECRVKLYVKCNRTHVNCSMCGKEKTVKNSDYKRSKNKVFFCNKECQFKFKRRDDQ